MVFKRKPFLNIKPYLLEIIVVLFLVNIGMLLLLYSGLQEILSENSPQQHLTQNDWTNIKPFNFIFFNLIFIIFRMIGKWKVIHQIEINNKYLKIVIYKTLFIKKIISLDVKDIEYNRGKSYSSGKIREMIWIKCENIQINLYNKVDGWTLETIELINRELINITSKNK